MCNHAILNKKVSWVMSPSCSCEELWPLKKDEKNKKRQISGELAILKKNHNWSIARLGVRNYLR